jgi:hypothetical protein
MLKLSKVATTKDFNTLKSLIDSFPDSESDETESIQCSKNQNDDSSSWKKRKAYDWNCEDSEDEIEFEKLMSSHIFSFHRSLEGKVNIIIKH